tara:strand:+ start:51437 stop:52357 length:921 start_codon:yes stop_codon:yes gene_type:complete
MLSQTTSHNTPKESPAVQALQRALANNHLGHALLLYGENLTSLEQIALDIIGTLLETETVLTHPDFFALRPTGKMRQISVENTRELIRKIQHSPLQSARKVALIYEVDRMHLSAANAFLKTLEEPPADTTLLLLTTHPHGILPTINSRCIDFRIPCKQQPINNEMWTSWLGDYADWMSKASTPGLNTRARADLILQAYGLTFRFSHCLDALTNELWEQDQESLPETLSEEERLALKTGKAKGLREQLLLEIEISTRDFALKHEAFTKLTRIIDSLEHLRGLLKTNLNESTALEAFFLSSLRVWAAK